MLCLLHTGQQPQDDLESAQTFMVFYQLGKVIVYFFYFVFQGTDTRIQLLRKVIK